MAMTGPRLYRETHGTHGPHVLLVHGIFSARSHWLPNLDALCEYARPIVVELWGHGHSPTPDDPTYYQPDYYVTEFERIREELGAERWFLVGQSLGAALTIRYALAHPDRVPALAFTNSASAFASPESQRESAAGREAQRRRIEENNLPDPRESPLNPSRNRRITPEVRAALEADIALHSPVGIARSGLYTAANASLYDRIAENTVPALMIVGEREERFVPNRRFIESHMTQLEVVGLNGGHGVNLDAPDDFNAALRSFFERFIEE